MININNYIIEKLHLNKNIDTSSSDEIYVVLYSHDGKGVVKEYETYDDVKNDIENNKDFYYYIGYKIKRSLSKELNSLLLDVYDKKKDIKELDLYVSKHKLEKLWNSIYSNL